MAMEKLRLGQMVSSKTGRDCSQSYLVLKRIDERFVLLANGGKRKVGNPKKKNIRHLVVHQAIAEDIEAKLSIGEEVTDEEIRSALKRLGAEM
ncbi:MAG: RNA-binding protein [bacterium]|jgi:ribosomal protein L14E/L6E/L27E